MSVEVRGGQETCKGETQQDAGRNVLIGAREKSALRRGIGSRQGDRSVERPREGLRDRRKVGQESCGGTARWAGLVVHPRALGQLVEVVWCGRFRCHRVGRGIGVDSWRRVRRNRSGKEESQDQGQEKGSSEHVSLRRKGLTVRQDTQKSYLCQHVCSLILGITLKM